MKKLAWLKKQPVLAIGIVGTAAVAIGLIVYSPSWTGFWADSTTTVERDRTGTVIKTVEVQQSGKTLWDWLSVLGVPLTLFLLGVWLQQQQQVRAEQQTKLEREITEANQQEEVLQAYFDRLSALLVDKNLLAIAAKLKNLDGTQQQNSIKQQELLDSSINVIRARTLSILRRLKGDRERKSSVIRFLIEADIVRKLRLPLSGADLSGADLSSANLSDADLSFANLSGVAFNLANLSGADLSFANLSGADLRRAYVSGAALNRANLSFASLSFADLSGAALSGADLSFANLSRADLTGTNLTGTNLSRADLSRADLNRAKNWDEEQLSRVELRDTRLPEGCKLDPNRDASE